MKKTSSTSKQIRKSLKVKLTKFGHACVLVETDDRIALFNPGKWSEYNLDNISHVDRLIVTHEHGDHLDVDKIKSLVDKFNDLKIVVNKSTQAILEEAGVKADIVQESMCTKPFDSPHDSLESFGAAVPESTGYHFKDVYTDPSDSHGFTESKAILALPVVGPWGHAVDAVAAMLKSKPQHVFLVHDWHLTREGFDWYQDVVEGVCKENNINFVRIANAEPVTINL